MERLGLIGIALAALLGAPAMALPADEPEEITIYGKIEVAQEDDEGEAIAVFIFDPSEGACLVASDKGQGRPLTRHVGTYAEVTGYLELSEDPAYDWTIVVSSFVLEDEEEEEEPEPEDDARSES